jgi:Lamin Tail Domain/CHU_C Type IX secretion signal domain
MMLKKSLSFKLTIVAVLLHLLCFSQPIQRYAVVISEVMADPSPAVALPNTEYIELRNTTNQPINLNGWKLSDGNSTATININFILQPDSSVVICTNSAAAALAALGTTIGVSNFPSLDNDADLIYLRSPQGSTIHAIAYNNAWYNNAVKSDGGWSLEMIDTKNPCTGAANWKPSEDSKGGTPGKKNSVDGSNKDNAPPALVRAFATDSITITLVFNEPLDSVKAAMASNYQISDGIIINNNIVAIPPLYDRVVLKLNTAIVRNKTYKVTMNGVTDCAGNTIGIYNTAQAGWATVADSLDVVINELLFNPKPDGVDYLELYNRSAKIINLKDLYIGNRSSSGIVSSVKQIVAEDRLLFPQQYVVLTEDAAVLQQQYLIKDAAAVIVLPSMPSYPDDKGVAILLNAQGKIIDELRYDEKWHFKLIDNNEGVALERINYNSSTNIADNWHSAATSAGYGTPGYQNSQYTAASIAAGRITVTPAVFSPDNDGFDDNAFINYQFDNPGFVCNITIYNANGRPVKFVTRNALCGLKGSYRWDGLDENNQKLPIGTYVVLTEVFTLNGKTQKFKNSITLARRF